MVKMIDWALGGKSNILNETTYYEFVLYKTSNYTVLRKNVIISVTKTAYSSVNKQRCKEQHIHYYSHLVWFIALITSYA